MENIKISIIVPIYNVERYLEKCIESILNQTYKNLEIILVDDGSTDGSGQIIDKYALKDNRVVAIHKSNGGVSSARNLGLENATGDYIGFIDSDDWIEPDMYKDMVESMYDSELDMVICNYYTDTEKDSKPMQNDNEVMKEVFGKEQLLEYVFIRDNYRGVAAYSWNKIFNKKLLITNGEYLKYDESYKIGEDVLWFAQVALKTESIKYIDKCYYHYVIRDNSATHSNELKKKIDHIRAYEAVVDIYDKNYVKEKIVDYVKRFLAYHAMNIAKLAYEQGNIDILMQAQRAMNRYKEEYITTNVDYPNRIEEFKKVLAM